MPEKNRRFEYRIMADLLVETLELDASQAKSSQGAIRELSASGCRLESSVDLELGQMIRLSFPLEGGYRIQQASARVVRRLSQRSHKVVGVEFVDLSEQDQYKIREFIIWKEAQGSSA